MITLKEFLEASWHEHYRIYLPNSDCLIFESYRTIHSPYYFDSIHEEKRELFNQAYYKDNKYCDNIYNYPEIIDAETKLFIERFGDYEVFSIEIGAFKPTNLSMDENDHLKIDYVEDPHRPGIEYLNCFNLFINVFSEKED